VPNGNAAPLGIKYWEFGNEIYGGTPANGGTDCVSFGWENAWTCDGTRLRLAGAGNAGRHGGPAGDFVLRVQVEPHPFFHRAGDDLTCEVPVTVAEAALGSHVEVPTPDGTVTIELPAGTQNGQRFRLRKRGLPLIGGGGKTRGDLFVEVKVTVPAVADDEGRRLLTEFARRHPEDPRQGLLRFAGAKE